MTRYTVVWLESALGELADEWMNSPDRNAVNAAVNAIDKELAVDAAIKGVALSEEMRAYFSFPIRVLYSVREDDRIVEVLRVRRL
jgi:hypothetical protein